MNLLDIPMADQPHADALARILRQGVNRWVVAMVERAIRREESAVSVHGLANSPALAQLLQRRRVELVQALDGALVAQLEARRDEGTATSGLVMNGPTLTLISESQIDAEIETARIVQLVESEAELPLLELAALSSRLHGCDRIDVTTVPLGPLACANALRDAVNEVETDSARRHALLRGLGTAMATQMREVYTELSQCLQRQGVEPIGYRIGAVDAVAPASFPASGAQTAGARVSAAEAPTPLADSMRELVAWAHRTQAASVEASSGLSELTLRIQPEASPGSAWPQLPQAAAEGLMQRLFDELRQQSSRSPSMAGPLQRLEAMARRVAVDFPQIWSDPEHVWWQLLDRLLAAAALHDDLEADDQRVLGHSLEALLQRLLGSPRLDAQACLRAADKVQRLAAQLLERAASPGAEDVAALQRQADRGELELAFRNQIVQQLRSTPTSGLMRRFLLEPWTEVLVARALRHGASHDAVAKAALVVDDLIRATAQPGQKVSRAQRAVLLRQVEEGLLDTELPRPRVDAELVELADLLRNPPTHPADLTEAWVEEPVETLPVAALLDLHAGLPTVPLGSGPADGEPVPTSAQWVESLQPGALCRLFLQGIWMSARLKWVGPGQRLFLFQSRHGGRSHTLTQRMLCRLREAGLATTIEDNLLRAQAMESLVRHTVI